MSRIPNNIDVLEWVLENPDEYFTFAWHLAEQTAHWQITGKRKPMHLKGAKYRKDRGK